LKSGPLLIDRLHLGDRVVEWLQCVLALVDLGLCELRVDQDHTVVHNFKVVAEVHEVALKQLHQRRYLVPLDLDLKRLNAPYQLPGIDK
jgi:hypothetical protein